MVLSGTGATKARAVRDRPSARHGRRRIVVSGADRTICAYRNGTPIGRAALTIAGSEPLGGAVFAMLEGESEQPSRWVPFRKVHNWMIVSSTAKDPGSELATMRRRIGLNPDFAILTS